MSSVRKVKYIDSSCEFQDDVDNTKKMYLELNQISPSTTRTITFPNANTTLVGTDYSQIITNKTFIDSTTYFADDSDNSKIMQFQLSGISTGTTRTLTVPNASTTLVGTDITQTLTNKTLTLPIISSISNTGTLTLPTTTDTLVGRLTTDSLRNKSLQNDAVFFVDQTDATKKLGFITSSATTGTTLTLAGTQTTNRTITFPDATDTVVCKNTSDTLTNKTLTSPIISTISNTGTLTLPTSTDTLVGRATTDTLTNKSLVDASTYIIDDVDNTKKMQFQISTISSGTTRTITIPNASTTMVGTDVIQTLVNKTLTSPIISTIVNTGILTLPTSTDTLVGRATTDTLSNKSFQNNTVFHVDQTDATKKIGFITSSATTSTTLTLAGIQTTNRTITFPDATTTVVGTDTTQTLSNKTLTSPVISSIVNTGTLTLPSTTDTLVGRATVDTLTNKTLTSPTISTIINTGTLTLPTSTDTLIGRATTDTLSNKSLQNNTVFHVDQTDATKKIGFISSGATTSTTLTLAGIQTTNRTITFPDATTTLVGIDTTQTLSNKTLTSPIISSIVNTGTLTLPTSTDTLVGRATTDTLTNKTLTSTTNTISASQLRTTTTDVVISGAAAPSAGQVLTATSGTAANWQTLSVTSGNFVDSSTYFVNSSNNTRKMQFNLANISNNTTRTLTIPDANTTLVGTDTTQTLTNKTISNTLINTSSSSTMPLVIKAAPGQTADLTEWQDSNGNVLSSFDSSGNLHVSTLNINNLGFNLVNGISYVASASNGGQNLSSLTINVPSGTTRNTAMVAHLTVRSTDGGGGGGTIATLTPPAGWQLLRYITNSSGNIQTIFIYVKNASASEPASYTWSSINPTTNYTVGGIATFSGVSPFNIINAEASQVISTSTTSFDVPAITTTKANTMLVAFYSYSSVAASWSVIGGMTQAYTAGSSAPNDVGESMMVAYKLQATAATVGGTGAFTATANAYPDNGMTDLLALTPIINSIETSTYEDIYIGPINTTGINLGNQNCAFSSYNGTMYAGYPTTVPLAVIGAGSQSSNLTEWRDVNGTVLSGIDSTGDLLLGGSVNNSYISTITTSPTANRTITLPDATDTLVGRATTDTLTNKTISAASNNISLNNYMVYSNTTTSTTSTSFVTMTSMTYTPPAGTYIVMFSASGYSNIADTAQTTYAIYKGGAIVTDSTRVINSSNWDANNNNAMYTQTIVTVFGTNAIDLRYKTSRGTFTVTNRNMILLEVG